MTYDEPYVLSSKEALSLLAAAHNYAQRPDRAINGRDWAEIVAEAALAKGHANLSDSISAMHSSIMGFHKGSYREIEFLLNTPEIHEEVREEAKGTGFEPAVALLFGRLAAVPILNKKNYGRFLGRVIDWDASSKVLLDVKQEHFPQDLTMIEKLNIAQASSQTRRR